jgi:ABC-type uncharacterized transport system permease subunit
MTLGLRVILLVGAIVCFVIAVFSDLHQGDWIAIGLALTTAAVLARDLGWADRTFGAPRRRSNP